MLCAHVRSVKSAPPALDNKNKIDRVLASNVHMTAILDLRPAGLDFGIWYSICYCE